MLRKFSFIQSDGTVVTLPVTPSGYTVSVGVNVESLNIHTIGDYAVPTTQKLQSIELTFELPSTWRNYAIYESNQATLVAWFRQMVTEKERLRFIVSGTRVNVPVFFSDFNYGEQDGTNDLYCTLTLQEYRQLEAVSVETNTTSAENVPVREEEAQTTTATTYTVQDGDNLWNIARQFYGDGSLYTKLATANNIANANLIYTGTVLTIPDATGIQSVSDTVTQVVTTTDYYAVTIAFLGNPDYWGSMVVNYYDGARNVSINLAISPPTTANVAAGTALKIQFTPKSGYCVDGATTMGFNGSCVGNSYYGLVTGTGSVSIRWGVDN